MTYKVQAKGGNTIIRNTLIAAISVLSLCLPAASFAQGAQAPTPSQSQPGGTSGKPAAARAEGGQAAKHELQVVRADTLLGMEVKNQQGEKLGEIENFMIDVKDGNIAYTVMDTGLFGKLLAVPMRVLTVKPGARTATLDVDKAKLQQAPSFATDTWPDAVERRWLIDVYTYYDTQPYPSIQVITTDPIRVARADKILGLDVENPQRENLGEIENLLIDMTAGRIASATLAFGGWLGLGENVAPVPWGALTFTPGAERASLNMDKEKLRKAPQFATDKWPATVERQWPANVYAHTTRSPIGQRTNRAPWARGAARVTPSPTGHYSEEGKSITRVLGLAR
jgi:sporulation protein YlmC with PRC-barrel domain